MNTSAPLSASRIAKVIRQAGGITIDWRTGRQPAAGFAVAPSKATERRIALAGFSAEHVSEYVREFRRLLELPGMCLGARVKEGIVYLDVSLVVEDAVTAAAIAADADQFAIRCLHESRSIPTEEAASGIQIAQEKRSQRYLTFRKAIKEALP
jgi:hypothetical protein